MWCCLGGLIAMDNPSHTTNRSSGRSIAIWLRRWLGLPSLPNPLDRAENSAPVPELQQARTSLAGKWPDSSDLLTRHLPVTPSDLGPVIKERQ
jgi:hypothetical protein